MFATHHRKQYLAVALAVLAAVSVWFYVKKILIPAQVQDAERVGRPRGNLSDLYPRWLGARELLLHGRDPYSAEMTRDIQRGVYGRTLDPSRANDPKDKQAFAYPVYVVFLLAPTITLDFAEIRPVFSMLLIVLVLVTVLIWKSVFEIKLSGAGLLIAALLTLASFPVVLGIRLQQLTIVVAALLAASFLARQSNRLLLSGFLMAGATIKPQHALLPVLAMIVWTLADWKQRARWLWGFFATMAVLVAASEYELPGWIPKFLQALRDYQQYTGGKSLLAAFLPSGLGTILGYLLLGYVGWTSWRNRSAAPDSPESRHLVCLLLVASICAMPNFATYNQVLLFPALLWFVQQNLLDSQRFLVRGFAWLTAALLLWFWVACTVLMPASIFLSSSSYGRVWQIPLYGTLQLPLAVLVLLLTLQPQAAGRRSLASVPRGVSCSL